MVEMAGAPEHSSGGEFTRGQVLRCEVGSVGSVEFVVERKVGAGDLYVDKVIHVHPGLSQRSFHAVEQKLEFLVNLQGSLAGLGIDPDPAGEVERIPSEHRATKRHLGLVSEERN